MSLFIPSFHFVPASEKLKPEWAMKAISYLFYNTRNFGLLDGKNVDEIEEYASGDFDMRPYKKMYKSLRKEVDTNLQNQMGPDYRRNPIVDKDMQFLPVAAIPVKLNSATALVQKIPIEVSCTATDALATQKKQDDINFLKNKPQLEADLQDFADQLNIGQVDLGTTKHSTIPFSSSPYGLDLNEPDELDVFVNMMYTLMVESSFETALQEIYKLKQADQVKLLEIMDQFKFGVSVNRCFESAITHMPDIEYKYPLDIRVPFSRLPDMSDRTHTFDYMSLTVLEMFNNFGNEIDGEEALDQLINAKGVGYCACNGIGNVSAKNFDTFKVNIIYCEVKSVDWVGIGSNAKSKKGFSYLTAEEGDANDRIWGQNTYCFWWLQGTKKVFNIHKLGYAQREVGREAYQSFSHNIYRSQKHGAVELCIPENKKIQIATIKMMYALIMSLPAGKYIDLKYLRGAMSGLKDESNEYTLDDLINLALEKNIMIGDTEGFDSKIDGQMKPFIDIPGGLKSEINGYITIIRDAEQNISKITGINDQLTGQGVNPDGLVGLQKLLINSSINSIHYCNEGIEKQCQKIFTIWGSLVQSAIAAGGKTKKAVENIIGSKKVSIIEGLNQIPMHTMGIFVTVNQREEEKAKYTATLEKLKLQGVISAADEYMLESIQNPKDKWALLAVKEKMFLRRKTAEQQAQYAQQQQIVQQQGQNQLANTKQVTESQKEIVYAKGDVQSKIISLASQLGMNASQLDGLIKKSLQDDRNKAQLDKSIGTLNVKNNLQQQEPLTATA